MPAVSPGFIKQLLQTALYKGIERHVFSGAQVSFSMADETIHTISAGTTAWPEAHYPEAVGEAINAAPDFQAHGDDRDSCSVVVSPVTSETLFDIASVTKLFTATIALTLVDENRLSLHQSMWNRFTLESLLSHESGLPAWKPLFETIPMEMRGTRQAYDRIVEAVLSTPVETAAGKAVYSDLGFIGLAHQLQQMTGQPLPELLQTRITAPLGMRHTFYSNDIPISKVHVSCTEACPWRRRILQGEVHDDNAWTMGGVAGHAGLFSTSNDLVTFGNAWLNTLYTDGIVSTQLGQLACERRPAGRGLGFDLKSEGASSIGNSASVNTFGHLGFTGASLWIDPSRHAVIALLTNRVHPSRGNSRIREFRPWFHEQFFASIPPFSH